MTPQNLHLMSVNPQSLSPDVTVMTLKRMEGGDRQLKGFIVYHGVNLTAKCHAILNPNTLTNQKWQMQWNFQKAPKIKQFSLLRKGNRAHFNKVTKEGKGLVIPHQQSIKPARASDYLHCINCEVYPKRTLLWRPLQRRQVKGLSQEHLESNSLYICRASTRQCQCMVLETSAWYARWWHNKGCLHREVHLEIWRTLVQ